MVLLSSCAQHPEVTATTQSPRENPSVVGMWDDGLVGENTMLELMPDGTGHIVSMAVERIQWQYSSNTSVLKLSRVRERDQKTITSMVKYSPDSDTLVGEFYGPNDKNHTFRRAAQGKIDWWQKVKEKNANQ
jgi:hypothetical protein